MLGLNDLALSVRAAMLKPGFASLLVLDHAGSPANPVCSILLREKVIALP